MDTPADWHPTWFKSDAAFVLEEMILRDPGKGHLRAQITRLATLCAETRCLNPSVRLKYIIYGALLETAQDIAYPYEGERCFTYINNVLKAMILEAIRL